ncbi:MAG: histidine phosphatase family protein [Leptospiraceae bacterium]|nr:histidine phosphatase family protein [Leptospiraceae bacterium]
MESKIIYFIRHSKSDWDTPFSHDKERALSERGLEAAKSLSKFIKLNKINAEFVYVSDAKRTDLTFSILNKDSRFTKKFINTEKLYESSIDDYIEFIHNTDDKIHKIGFVGHNPEMEMVVNFLLGQNDKSIFAKFATSSLVALKFDVSSWKEIPFQKGKLSLFYIPPRE